MSFSYNKFCSLPCWKNWLEYFYSDLFLAIPMWYYFKPILCVFCCLLVNQAWFLFEAYLLQNYSEISHLTIFWEGRIYNIVNFSVFCDGHDYVIFNHTYYAVITHMTMQSEMQSFLISTKCKFLEFHKSFTSLLGYSKKIKTKSWSEKWEIESNFFARTAKLLNF